MLVSSMDFLAEGKMHWILTLVKLGSLYTKKITNPDVVRTDALNTDVF